MSRWTDREIGRLVAVYVDPSRPVDLDGLAKDLGRDKANVCRKARSLGLTNQRRAKVEQRKPTRKHATPEEARAAIGAATKARIAAKGHPRGALGLTHTPEAKAAIGARSRASWRDPKAGHHSPERKQAASDRMVERIVSGEMRAGHTRCRGGKRADLGDTYFRSAWEANYARYLNMLIRQGEIAGWEYEPKTFTFDHIKRGTRAYTPDFRVDMIGGGHVWHEVKGWMDAKSKTRLARFARCYPDEKLVVVDGKWFRSANKTLPGLIPEWERGTVHVAKVRGRAKEYAARVKIEPA